MGAKKEDQTKLIKSSGVLGGGEKREWSNPLRGGYKDIAAAEVALKGLGLFVGVKFKF